LIKGEIKSLVRVYELDEITSNGGKDRSVTTEHPRGLKNKGPDFMQGEYHALKFPTYIMNPERETKLCFYPSTSQQYFSLRTNQH
jgi:hypothetical protein